MTPPTHPQLLAVAVEAARKAGTHALTNKHRREEVMALAAHDVKLVLDLECQRIAESVIAGYFPAHRFIGEENGVDQALPETGFNWIVDPIDGTVNFNTGLPGWCCSVAVAEGPRVVAGVVYAPESAALYTATCDQPAQCNGAPIRVSERRTLANAIVYMGTGGSSPDLPAAFARMLAVAGNIRKIRIMGSAALDLCQLACGLGEGYFEDGVYIWDTAAAGLILRQAGGRTEELTDQPSFRQRFLATNGHIHAALRAIIAPLLPPRGH